MSDILRPRAYTTRLAALTLGVTPKWIDNVLARSSLPGITGGRQGVDRAISDDGLVALEIVRVLNVQLGVPLASSAHLATRIVEAGESKHPQASSDAVDAELAPGITLRLAAARLRDRLRLQLEAANEELPAVKRGRPRTRSEGP